jgi:hypothetical protein
MTTHKKSAHDAGFLLKTSKNKKVKEVAASDLAQTKKKKPVKKKK